MEKVDLDGDCGCGACCRVRDAPVGECSVSVGYRARRLGCVPLMAGDGCNGNGFGLFPLMLCFGEQPIVGVDRQVASSFAGGASLPVGTFGTDDPESDLSFGADGGGVTGRAGDPVLVVVDNKVVAGELVRTQPRVTTLPDGFDDGPVTSSPQFGADLSNDP